MSEPKKKKRGRGRPKKQKVFSAAELKAQSRASMKRSQERYVDLDSIDVEEFCEQVLSITHRNKMTTEEWHKLRLQVELLYHKHVIESQDEEDAQMKPYVDPLKALALEQEHLPIKQMSRETWNKEHGLRKDGKGLKPGPKKQKPKSIFDLDLKEPTDPLPDFEWLEKQWLEQRIEQMKNEPNYPVGRRLRDDATIAMQRRRNERSFWQ